MANNDLFEDLSEQEQDEVKEPNFSNIVDALVIGITDSVRLVITKFIQNISSEEEMRNKLLNEWNSISDIKISEIASPSPGEGEVQEVKVVKVEKKCQKILKTGNRQGLPCEKPCKKDSEFCYNHSKVIEVENKVENKEKKLCKHKLERGNRAGGTCNKPCSKNTDYCSTHAKKHLQVVVKEVKKAKKAKVVEKVVEVEKEEDDDEEKDNSEELADSDLE